MNLNIKGIYFFVNRCIPFSAKSIFWGKVQVSNSSNVVANGGTAGNNMVKLRVRAFRFQDSGSLLFSCTVCKDQACTGGASVSIRHLCPQTHDICVFRHTTSVSSDT